ncbi:alanyl-tRNA editing protein [Thalassospiraceae bacterium LMO-JJ14]|nr:alanyl-tRNA editing protein [Thalassospiraceae bacterium LMO-JJ14]
MTEELFREDSYLRTCDAMVIAADDSGIELDCTIFYAMGGGQPGDTGVLRTADGREVAIQNTVKDRESGRHLHIPDEGAPALVAGDKVTCEIDWDRRYRLMRMHSALHLLCAVVDGGVTGGQIGEEKSRLDFDLPDTNIDKEGIEAHLNKLVDEAHAMGHRWITDDEMAANEDLVRTMSVKPPMGAGRVRLMEIDDGVDLQPCGGTHVANTSEIGALRVGKIENKGKHNRRINVHLINP